MGGVATREALLPPSGNTIPNVGDLPSPSSRVPAQPVYRGIQASASRYAPDCDPGLLEVKVGIPCRWYNRPVPMLRR